ncbi:MAG: hypothetical protein ACHP84_10595 [Caulobacterales bacterium]
MYERVLNNLALAVSPQDFVEWIWVKDIVDLEWDAGRARRAKTVRLTLARRSGIETILRADNGGSTLIADLLDDQIGATADRIMHGDKAAIRSLGEALKRLGLTQDSLNDAAYHAALGDIERLQQLIDNANGRRDAVLREIDRRRDAFGKRARPAAQAMEQVIDAEFS